MSRKDIDSEWDRDRPINRWIERESGKSQSEQGDGGRYREMKGREDGMTRTNTVNR